MPSAVPAAASARVSVARVLTRLRLRVLALLLAPLLLVAVRTRLAARRPTRVARLLTLLCATFECPEYVFIDLFCNVD